MKRIIEIDEDLYNRIKDHIATLSDIPVLCGSVDDSKTYDEWISVDERLPEPLHPVLAYDNNDRFVAWYNEGWSSSDSQFDKNTPIVAWMPIPQYKGGESDA